MEINCKFEVGQLVYFLYRNYIKKGNIEKISIDIDKNSYGIEFHPTIRYFIKNDWYYEYQLWEDKKELKKWIDNNFCCTIYVDTKENFCTWNNKKVFLLNVFERINNRHPWKKKKIAEIFYIDESNTGYFRYVFYDDIKDIIYEHTYLSNIKYELMKTYGSNYIEDGIYNFVNYDGIKF